MSASKHWVIAATHTAAGLSFERGGQPVATGLGADPALSPVEFMLVSAAGCMALSLKAAALANGASVTTFRVEVRGTKPADAPSRLSEVDVRIALTPALQSADAARLIADAQQMCTVTNTIRDAARLTVGIADAAPPPDATTAPNPTGDPA